MFLYLALMLRAKSYYNNQLFVTNSLYHNFTIYTVPTSK